jgi:hypothetical protein
MFKWQIAIDPHSPRLIPNQFHFSYPPHFSLPSTFKRDNEPFWELKGQNGRNRSLFRKTVFYKQILDFYCPFKILCDTSKLLDFVKITGPHCRLNVCFVATLKIADPFLSSYTGICGFGSDKIFSLIFLKLKYRIRGSKSGNIAYCPSSVQWPVSYQDPDLASEMDQIQILHKRMDSSLKPEPNRIVLQIPISAKLRKINK